MKKYFYYFLISCCMMSFQLVYSANVIAKPVDGLSIVTNAENVTQAIPKLVKLEQLSQNQIKITYDRDVDLSSAQKATNYWVQSTKDVTPTGIATLGKNDKVNSKNALTSDLVSIKPMDNSKNIFILTFKNNVKAGMEHKLIICYVIVPGAPPYNGDNGSAVFIGK